jgi:histidinol-phosphate/aromatic aminotransferase/cobyric acid decarboxylase-like protein/imidazoleglycerol phosphate dehydratase HisB
MKLVELEAYQWPPSSEVIARRVGLDPRDIVRFDGNVAATAPVSARPAALARALADINEYDRGRYQPLRESIADLHGVDVDQVALGAGSDEFIVLLARLFATGGTIASVPVFSYSMYRFAALMANATVIEDPARADLVFVCRPNNPTGELPDIPDVAGQLVIDEAYAHFAGEDALDRVSSGAIILRTFSKAYGLAGARVGYAIGKPELIRAISSHQAPLSVSSISAALALAALSTPLDVSAVVRERERLSLELADLGLTPLKSFTNFLFVEMNEPEKLVDQLMAHGAVTRAYPGGLRVSVRDEVDNNFLLDALRSVLGGEPMPPRYVRHNRATAETLLRVRIRIPGEGRVLVSTGAGFYDHMLQQLAFHAGMDLRIEGVGDLETGDHHTVEDTMRTFGEAFDRALGDRKGLTRYGEARVPMDEALAHAVVDLSGRSTASLSITPDEGMVAHAFESLAQTARITLHVNSTGANAHHVAEASFKAVGRALAQAMTTDGSLIRSTKGTL